MHELKLSSGSDSVNVASLENDQFPLLMLHGVTRRWQSFLPLVPSLSLRFQPNILDFRGHGRSDRSESGYCVVDYANDALAVLDARSTEKFVVYGHSLGAMVSAIVAAQRPDQIAAIIMEDPPFHTMGNNIGETVLLSLFSIFKQFAGDERPVATIANDLADSMLIDPKTNQSSRLGDSRDMPSLRFTAACLKQLDSAVLEPILAGEWLNGFDIDATCRSVQCPALLIQADTSAGGMLTDDVTERVRSYISDLTHVKVANCGHLVHWSETQRLVNWTSSFLESCDLQS